MTLINSIFNDTIFKRLLTNAKTLLTGNAISSIFSLISFALCARALGPELFGVFVTIQTYVLIIDRLINFQSWQAIIKYGTDDIQHNRIAQFKKLIRYGFSLDITTAILGTIIAYLGVSLLSQRYVWSPDLVHYAHIYCFLILFNISGTPIGILRLFNRFKTYTYPQIISQGLKLIFILIAYSIKAPFQYYIIIWFIFDILNYLLLVTFSLLELKNQNLLNFFKKEDTKQENTRKGIWSFVISTNLISSIRLATRELDLLIIGGILGLKAVGMFKIAKLFASIIIKIFDPIYETIYPELTKLVSEKKFKKFSSLILKTSLMSGAGVLIYLLGFIIFGQFLIDTFFSSAYSTIYSTTIFYLFAIAIAIATTPLTPAVLAIGEHKSLFRTILIATVIYFICLPRFLVEYNLNGAAYAYILFYITWATLMIFRIYHKLKKSDLKDA